MKPRHSILLVDDEPEILFSLRSLLRQEFDLYTAQSGAEALEVLHQRPIDVIMTDQRMPQMTGVELLRRARGECPRAVRIVFTGYADIKSVVDAINEGQVYRYLTKPWDPDDVITVLRQACEQHDRSEERRVLLRDLQAHLTTSADLFREVSGPQTEALATARKELLARLERALEGGET